MAKKQTKQTAKRDFSAYDGIGQTKQASNASEFYWLNYNPGTFGGRNPEPGYWYIVPDADDDWELPSPWSYEMVPLSGEMKEAWVCPALKEINWIAYREAREVDDSSGRTWIFGTFTPNAEMYTPNGEYLGDNQKRKKKHFVTLHPDFDDLPKPVIMTMNGKARELMLDNPGGRWGHEDMGPGILNELTDYVSVAVEDSGTMFRVFGPWKITLVPETDDKGNPVFYSIPTKESVFNFNPIQLVMPEHYADALVTPDELKKIKVMYADWVQDWVETWPEKGLAETYNKDDNDGFGQNVPSKHKDVTRQMADEDDIPF